MAMPIWFRGNAECKDEARSEEASRGAANVVQSMGDGVPDQEVYRAVNFSIKLAVLKLILLYVSRLFESYFYLEICCVL